MVELILSGITILLNIYLGLFVFFRNPRSWTSRFFLALTIFINGYVITNYLSLHPPVAGPESQLLWIRIVMSEASFLGPTLLLLVMTFPRDKLEVSRFKLGLICSLMIISVVISLSPYLFTAIEYPNGNPVPIPGPAIPIFFLDFAGLFLLSFIVLIVKYRRSVGLEKVQIKYFLTGIILTFTLLTLSTLFLVVLLKNSQFVFLGPAYTMILVGFITYAIVKHRFLDIRLVIARTVVYSLLLTLVGVVYVIAAFVLSSFFLNFEVPLRQLGLNIVLTVVLMLSFGRIRNQLETITDKLFYKGHYDFNGLLSTFGSIMSSTIELEELTNKVLEVLTKEIRIANGGFVLFDQGKVYKVVGFASHPQEYYLQLINLIGPREVLVFNELEEGPLKQELREGNISVCTILRAKGELIGILVLSDKLSGEIYSDQDLRLLKILSPEVSVAIQNAKSYDQVKRFNVTLKQEVDRATQDLKVANSQLKELDKLKDDFVSVASHELRTPMTAIRSYAWMALHRSDIPLSEKVQKYLIRVLISTERLINLVNDMLNISRIESGRVEVRPAVFDIQALLKDLVSEVSIKASEKQIKVIIKEATLPPVFADPEKIYQVVLNLLGNSLKFTPENGSVVISFFTDGKTIETSVTDSGVGISPEDLSKLFQKFGRLDSSYVAAATSGGSGLGLYISKSLIELMKGKIWARSEGMGKGTTFTFSLPIATPDNLAHQENFRIQPPKEEVRRLEPMTPMTI